MKVIIPASGTDITSEISKTFGRTAQFLLVDSETMEAEVIKNEQNMQSAQGAGIQSAQLAAKSGADALITLHCGPKAYRVLTESGIDIYTGTVASVKENVKQLKGEMLNEMSGSNVEGHWA